MTEVIRDVAGGTVRVIVAIVSAILWTIAITLQVLAWSMLVIFGIFGIFMIPSRR